MSEIIDTEDAVPLTKPKGKKKIAETLVITQVPPPQPTLDPVLKNESVPQTKAVVEEPVKKKRTISKPKTEAQLKQFELVKQKRQESVEKRKLEKRIEASKLLLAHNIPIPETPVSVPTKTAPTPPPSPEESSSSEEEEIIVKKAAKKPRKKRVIKIEMSDSDSSESEPEPVKHEPPKKNKSFRSQQNRKSVITMHTPKPSCYFDD